VKSIVAASLVLAFGTSFVEAHVPPRPTGETVVASVTSPPERDRMIMMRWAKVKTSCGQDVADLCHDIEAQSERHSTSATAESARERGLATHFRSLPVHSCLQAKRDVVSGGCSAALVDFEATSGR
jgi:hypothetical protein